MYIYGYIYVYIRVYIYTNIYYLPPNIYVYERHLRDLQQASLGATFVYRYPFLGSCIYTNIFDRNVYTLKLPQLQARIDG